MKKLLFFLLAGIVASTVFLSCSDKFNEESFLRLQAKLKRAADSAKAAQLAATNAATATAANTAATAVQTAQVAALNTAGQLASFVVQVLEDKTPLAGVSVVLTNTGGTAPVATVTTDANGNAVFPNVVIGGVTVTMTKAGYATADVLVSLGNISSGTNFTTVTTPGPNGTTYSQIVPIKKTVTAVFPMFATTGTTSVAIVKGNVQIETDLTNTTFEIPQGLTLTAQIAVTSGEPGGSITSVIVGNGGAAIQSYTFATGNLGTAVVNNTTGAYSMTVPASSSGISLDIVGPTLTANQTLWVNSVGTGAVAATTTRIKRSDIPATFTLGSTADAFPAVQHIAGTVPTPNVTLTSAAPSGVGFTFDAVAIARTLDGTGAIGGPSPTTVGNTTYALSNRGSGYTAPPTITVTATSPVATSPATAGPQMTFYATGISVTAVGSGYNASTNGTIDVVYTAGGVDRFPGATIPFTTTAAGALPATITIPTSGFGFAPDNQITTNAGFGAVTAFKLVLNTAGLGAGTGAVLAGTFTGDVNGVIVSAGNAKYATAPSFAFSSGTAAFGILEYKTQWYLTENNTAVTVPYKVQPNLVTLNYPASTYTGAFTATTVNWENVNGSISGGNNILTSTITTDGTNLVRVATITSQKLRTNGYSVAAPTTTVTATTRTQATATFTISTTTGAITSVVMTNDGAGYEAAPVISLTSQVTGGPGTGFVAPAILGSIDPVTKVFTPTTALGTITVTTANGGTNYWNNLNRQISLSPPSGLVSVTAKTGQTYIRDIKFGTGNRSVDVYN